nr:putative peptidoglycan glycosyltransferase FtsW [uncultured Faecalimonas sp.]
MATRRNIPRGGARKKIEYFDYNLLAVLIFIICFGLIMLYSASAYNSQAANNGDGMFLFRKQALITVASFVVMIIISKIDYHLYAPFAKTIYYISIFLMVLVRWSPLGIESNGSRRWLGIKDTPLQMQPSEVAKIAVILFIPYIICQLGKYIKTSAGVTRVLVYGGFSAFSVFYFTDNLSTAIIVAGIVCGMIFVAHPKTKPFIKIAVGGIIAVGLLLVVILVQLSSSDNFRIQRVVTWLQPDKHMAEGGYQVMQGLYAIGSGGFWGKGLGNSVQKLSAIPEVQNDMILAAICEELGIFGAIVILILFGMLLYRLMFIAQNAPDLYGSLIVTGIFTHIALQVILNIAVVTNLIPTTGITLPFFSYGGTSILFLMSEMGLALGVSRAIKFEET